MNFLDIVNVGGAIIVSLGGASAILFGFSSWLGKVWADRLMEKEKAKFSRDLEQEKAKFSRDLEDFKSDLTQRTESHKVRLKKSEFIFEKEYEAASELVSLIRDIIPTFHRPDMDWYEACDDMAADFEKTENRLHAYIKAHGAILPAGVRHLLSLSYGIAGSQKFDVNDGDVPSSANAAADTLHGHLQQAELEMLEQVRSQFQI